MEKYKFRLDKVLEVRLIEEEQAENLLAKARMKAREIEQEIRQLEQEQHNLYQFIRSNKKLRLTEIRSYRQYIQTNRQLINKSEASLFSQQEEVESFRQDLLNKRMKRKALENLKEKDYQRYYKEMLSKEQKILDELGMRSSGIREAK